MFSLLFFQMAVWANPWVSSEDRFYLADPQVAEGIRIQMLFTFTRDANIILAMFADRKPAIMMEGPCRSLSAASLECDFVAPKTGEVVVTKGFTYDSYSQSIVYDGRTKACRIRPELVKEVTDGQNVLGCSRDSSSKKEEQPSSSDDDVWEIARKEYPSDTRMQNYVYEKQASAKKYMSSVGDSEVKQIALREYPSDYSMQKYVYNKQVEAKKYMSSVEDSEVKKIALREYPSDYSMQKYVYNKQADAKKYMMSVPDSPQKEKAIREYPSDYSMQKYIYNKSQ